MRERVYVSWIDPQNCFFPRSCCQLYIVFMKKQWRKSVVTSKKVRFDSPLQFVFCWNYLINADKKISFQTQIMEKTCYQQVSLELSPRFWKGKISLVGEVFGMAIDWGDLTTTPKRGGIKGDPKMVRFSATVWVVLCVYLFPTATSHISESSPHRGLRHSHSILWPKRGYPSTVSWVPGAYRKSW